MDRQKWILLGQIIPDGRRNVSLFTHFSCLGVLRGLDVSVQDFSESELSITEKCRRREKISEAELRRHSSKVRSGCRFVRFLYEQRSPCVCGVCAAGARSVTRTVPQSVLGGRHVKEIKDDLDGAKSADTPMIVSQSDKMDNDSRALSLRDATLYQRLVAKFDYLAMDCPDIRYAASIMGSHASSTKDADMVIIKRVGQFLIGRPITWTHYRWRVR